MARDDDFEHNRWTKISLHALGVKHGVRLGTKTCINMHQTSRRQIIRLLVVQRVCRTNRHTSRADTQLTVRLDACEDETLRWVRDWTRKLTQDISGRTEVAMGTHT